MRTAFDRLCIDEEIIPPTGVLMVGKSNDTASY
jgi:hypothetical protein